MRFKGQRFSSLLTTQVLSAINATPGSYCVTFTNLRVVGKGK